MKRIAMRSYHALRDVPFFDQKKVVAILDALPSMSDGDRAGWDPLIMTILSTCVMRDRFKLAA
jgi:asparagine synthase (glutamine-hydrolysing)